VFLNIISVDITPFGLSTCIMLAILAGKGISYVLEATRKHPSIGIGARRAVKAAICALPAIPFAFSFGQCDQSLNYTGYEHALNIFRTVSNRGTLFIEGDNILFPVTYGRIVEHMREDVTLYDRYDLFFKMPFPDNLQGPFHGEWKDFKPVVERRIVEKAHHGVFLASYDPSTLSLAPGQTLMPYGCLFRMFKNEEGYNQKEVGEIWDHYATATFYDNFQRDYMTRQVSAYFFFSRGRYYFMANQSDTGFKYMKLASRIGYDDAIIHSDIGIFLTNEGLFDQARKELEKASLYSEDLGAIYNNWGYYYYTLEDYDEAVLSYRRAVELRPKHFNYYNNLGLALYHGGQRNEASVAFKKSLALNENQPKVTRLLETHGLIDHQ